MNNAEKIREIMQEIFQEEITEDFSKYTTEKWDSFAHLDLMVRLEEEFHVSFTPDEIGSMESFREIVETVEGK